MSRLEEQRKHREYLLDEALKETFPASDPPSIARPEIIAAKGPPSVQEEKDHDV